MLEVLSFNFDGIYGGDQFIFKSSVLARTWYAALGNPKEFVDLLVFSNKLVFDGKLEHFILEAGRLHGVVHDESPVFPKFSEGSITFDCFEELDSYIYLWLHGFTCLFFKICYKDIYN